MVDDEGASRCLDRLRATGSPGLNSGLAFGLRMQMIVAINSRRDRRPVVAPRGPASHLFDVQLN